MAEIVKAQTESKVRSIETVTLTVTFQYEKINGAFQTPEDEAHYNKYAEYLTQEN